MYFQRIRHILLKLLMPFNLFCDDNRISHTVLDQIENREVQQGQAYLVIKDSDLVKIVKDCKRKSLKIGTDVGIISYNDAPMKEIVGSGITVISTDFLRMGKDCANFIVNKGKVTENNTYSINYQGIIIETNLYFRSQITKLQIMIINSKKFIILFAALRHKSNGTITTILFPGDQKCW